MVNNTPRPHSDNCGFCGKSKSSVPLMVMSGVSNNTICSFCAIIIVQQTMEHMTQVSSAFSQVVREKPEWFDTDEKTGAVKLINPGSILDIEIDKSNAH